MSLVGPDKWDKCGCVCVTLSVGTMYASYVVERDEFKFSLLAVSLLCMPSFQPVMHARDVGIDERGVD